jgi:putative salt-induced outer membrane protein
MVFASLSALSLVAAAPAPAASPEALPPPVRAMIDAAIAAGDAPGVAAVLRFARETNPAAAAEIDAIDAAWQAELAAREAAAAEARKQSLAAAGPLDHWKGQLELGASRSTGNSNSLGLYGALSVERSGLEWRHKLTGRADVQETNGNTTTQRVLASWQPNYRFDDHFYAFGLAQYEHDKFLGYSDRYTASGGVGVGVVASPRLKLDFEGGPAFRHTAFTDGRAASTLAGRASLDLNWKIAPTLQLTQTSALYVEAGDTSASALTALDTTLLGALKARFSYNIQYERNAPAGVKPVDTLSRATLIYSF